jgi:hypothetical protein
LSAQRQDVGQEGREKAQRDDHEKTPEIFTSGVPQVVPQGHAEVAHAFYEVLEGMSIKLFSSPMSTRKNWLDHFALAILSSLV